MGRATTIATYVPQRTTIVGTDTAVSALLRVADRERRLLTDPAEIARTFTRLADGRVSVQVRLLVPRPAPSRALPTLGIVRVLAWSLGFAAVLTAAVVGLAYALGPVRAAIARWAESGGAAAAVLILLFAGWLAMSVKRRHACKGLHCDGCSRRH